MNPGTPDQDVTENADVSFASSTAVPAEFGSAVVPPSDVSYRQYSGEVDLTHVMSLIDNELSEPYSIFTYRYFLHTWPTLCFLALHEEHCFGTIVCKLEPHGELMRGYIAMLVVEHAFRGLGVGTKLVRQAIEKMMADGDVDEVVLEAEVTNQGALSLYTNLGFIKDKRLARYYMNGVDAFRLKLLLPLSAEKEEAMAAAQLSDLSLQKGQRSQMVSHPAKRDNIEHGACMHACCGHVAHGNMAHNHDSHGHHAHAHCSHTGCGHGSHGGGRSRGHSAHMPGHDRTSHRHASKQG